MSECNTLLGRRVSWRDHNGELYIGTVSREDDDKFVVRVEGDEVRGYVSLTRSQFSVLPNIPTSEIALKFLRGRSA